MHRRPLSVAIIGCLFIIAGAGGLALHAAGLRQHPFQSDAIWIEGVSLLAVLAGVFLLRGRAWARWLALGWMGFHVVLSVFHTLPELAVHALFLALLTYFLFRPSAARYFGPARV